MTLRNVTTLQSKQNLLKVCLEIVISKNLYHYRKRIDWFLYCTKGYFWKDYRKLQNVWKIQITLSLWMKSVIINLYTSSYITRLFVLVIIACPTIFPENPSRGHTWATPTKHFRFLTLIVMNIVTKVFSIVDLWISRVAGNVLPLFLGF